MRNKKSQSFMITIIVLILIMLISIHFLFKQVYQAINFDDSYTQLETEATRLSRTLLGKGFPQDWSSNNVTRIGISEGYKISNQKVALMKAIDYEKTKSLLGIRQDYLIYFLDQNNNPISINGICYLGYNKLNITSRFNLSYYHGPPIDGTSVDYFRSFLQSQGAAIFNASGGMGNKDDFLDSLENYSHIFIDSGQLTEQEMRIIESNASATKKNIHLSRWFMPSNNFQPGVSGQYTSMFGAQFNKWNKDVGGTIINNTLLINLSIGEIISFPNQAPNFIITVTKGTTNQFSPVANVTISNPSNDQLMGKSTIASWVYGNSSITYFSYLKPDLDNWTGSPIGDAMVQHYEQYLLSSTKKTCTIPASNQYDLTDIVRLDNIVTIEDNDQELWAKMVVLVW